MTSKNTRRQEARTVKHHAYHVVEANGDAQRARWIRIGVAFAHDDGDGETLIIDCLPIHFDGRIVLRAPKAE